MEETIQDTGIVRRITRRPTTLADWDRLVKEGREDHSVEKRLSDVAQSLQEIVAAYPLKNAIQVINGKRHDTSGHRYGDLAMDAPPEAFDARDALMLLDDLRAFISQKNLDRAVIAAYELGFTCCQIGVRPHEATVKGRAKGPRKKTENAASRRELIREEFIKIRDARVLTKQSEIIRRMIDRATLPDGSKMPSESVIERATKGLTAFKTPRKRTPKR